MAKQETNETVGAGAISSVPVLSIEEVRQLEIVRVKSVREGKEPSCSCVERELLRLGVDPSHHNNIGLCWNDVRRHVIRPEK